MRSEVVIIVTPALIELSCMAVTPEQIFVQAFAPESTIEALDKSVLHRFARCIIADPIIPALSKSRAYPIVPANGPTTVQGSIL